MTIVITLVVLRPGVILARGPATIAVMPMTDTGNDPRAAQMAAEVGGDLADGLAKIENIRILVPGAKTPADFVVSGELQKSEQAWTVRSRMTETATGEVKWTASYSVSITDDMDLQLQQSRLAAGVGHALALRINELMNADTRSTVTTGNAIAGRGKVAIEQATAHINQTSPERFQAAQAMFIRRRYSDRPPRYEYVLTQKARDFFPVLVALFAWGNKHLAPKGEAIVLASREDIRPLDPVIVDAIDMRCAISTRHWPTFPQSAARLPPVRRFVAMGRQSSPPLVAWP